MSESSNPQEVYLALQRRARRERRVTQELFEFYVLERFLYRLSISEHRDSFVLKGGLLLAVLGARRPTRDADVLARNIDSDEETLLAAVKEIAGTPVEDSVAFDTSQARAGTIREHAVYPGTRIVVPAALGRARLQLRLDVNLGDPADAEKIEYPTLLSDEPSQAYPGEGIRGVVLVHRGVRL